MAKKKYRGKTYSAAPAAPQALMWGSGYSGADFNPTQGLIYWPTLDTRKQAPLSTLMSFWRKCRALEANSGIAAQAVSIVPRLQGWLMPRPSTKDQEWNREALDAFVRIALSEEVFDRAGELNYKTAQLFNARASALEGDSLTVLTESGFGSASFLFYEAPQIQSPKNQKGWTDGVLTDRLGRAVAYGLRDPDDPGKTTIVKRENAMLVKEMGGRRQLRGLSGLHRAVNHLIDISEIIRDTKTGVKLGAALGLIRTQQKEQGRTGMMGNLTSQATNVVYDTPQKVEDVVFGGQVLTLAPGQDVRALLDNRPSPNMMGLVKHLMSEVAFGIGLPPEVVWDPSSLSSASMRFVMELLKRWLTIRHVRQQAWCHMVYRYILAKEIQRGTLRRCTDPGWLNVTWVPLPDLTIDTGRVGNLQIDLTAAGLADLDSWWLKTEGITYADAVERQASNIAHAKNVAADNGLTLAELFPGRTRGGQAIALEGRATPQAPADTEPDTHADD